MSDADNLDSQLDELYAGPADGFVAARDELAKVLKASGDKAAAAEVKGRRRPTAAAALVNRLSRDRAKDIAELAKAGKGLREATAAGDGKRLRAAAKQERETIGLLMEAAEELASEGGGAASVTLDRVAATFRAATRDPEVGELVGSGRLDRERSAATFGEEPLEPVAPKKSGGSKRKAGKRAEGGGKKAEQAKEALRRAESELEQAEGAAAEGEDRQRAAQDAVEDAERELTEAREALRESKAEAKVRRAAVAKARRRVEGARKKAG